MSVGNHKTLVLACGALAHELVRVIQQNAWQEVMDVQCLPAEYHNHPQKIVPALRDKLDSQWQRYQQVLIAYSDCGTGGKIDDLMVEFADKITITRLPGAHCYEMFASNQVFNALSERAVGTLYLTDFLARNFERIFIKGLGIDRYPELQEMYFGNYTDLVYLAQLEDAELSVSAQAAATRLGLTYQRVVTGDTHLDHAMRVQFDPTHA